MSNQVILRRLRRLEKVFAVEPEEDCVDVLMWNGSQGGIFGHTHLRFSGGGRRTGWAPCSDEEEIEVMLEHYERTEHKIPGTNNQISFSEFLECYSYLGSEELEAKRRRIIEQLKGGEDGARLEGTCCRAC